MKKGFLVIIVTMVVLATFSISGNGVQKANLGPCVRQCVHAYNPSLSDAKGDQFIVADFNAQKCVELCKESPFPGVCKDIEDECCNVFYQYTDPDCGIPCTTPGPSEECPGGNYCNVDGLCHALQPSGQPCQFDYQCQSGLLCQDSEPGKKICYTP